MADGDIKFLVTMDAQDAMKVMRDFNVQLDTTAQASDTADKAQKSFAGSVALGSLAAQAAQKILSTLSDAIAGAKDEFLDAEKAGMQLEATLQNLGIRTDENIKVLDDFAGEMARVTTVDDDAVKSVMALGLRMGVSGDQIREATKSAIGLSKAFGIDLEAAMKMVAQATEGEFAMMGRYVPQLRATEDATEKMNIATRVMSDGFAIAQAEVNTTGGKLLQAANEANNTKEAIGGLAVRFETLAIKAITPAVAMLSDFVGWLDQVDQRALKDNIAKRWAENKAAFEAAAKAAGILEQEQKKLFEDHGNISKTEEGVRLYAEALDDLIATNAKAAKGYNDFVKAQQPVVIANGQLSMSTGAVAKELERVRKAEEEQRKASEKQRKAAADLKREFANIIPVEVDLAKTNQAILEPSIEGVVGELINMDDQLVELNGSYKKTFGDFVTEAAEAWNKYGETAMDVIGMADAVFYQSLQNKQTALENSYKADLERIQKSTMSEQEKADAIAKLDEDYDAKRRELKKKQATQDKIMASVQATINTFEAATKAYAVGGPIFGPILAGVITALGLALVAKIMAQPIPLAKGAIFNQPTLLAGANGSTYQVAEAGEPEIVATPSNIRKAIGMDKGAGASRMAPVNVTVPVYVGREKVEEILIQVVEDASRSGRLRLSAKSVHTR